MSLILAVSTISPRCLSTDSHAFTAALKLPVCPTISGFAKFKQINPNLFFFISMITFLVTSSALISGFKSYVATFGDGQRILSSPIYEYAKKLNLTLRSENHQEDFKEIRKELSHKLKLKFSVREHYNHIVLTVSKKDINKVESFLSKFFSNLSLMSSGENIEIFKEVGLPKNVIQKIGINEMNGTHGIGHTRMATESAVTTLGAHPFSTGPDQCLVHNGSLSNHNQLRQKLISEGMEINTENDTEVAASYLSLQIKKGKTLEQSLELALSDLDGFYTFLVGTKDGFGVLRDPISCKPAVMAEN